MSKQYSCDLCKKVFNQKGDFTRHKNKKAPCITLTDMIQIKETTEANTDIKNKLKFILSQDLLLKDCSIADILSITNQYSQIL
jgi:hypothetical protein